MQRTRWCHTALKRSDIEMVLSSRGAVEAGRDRRRLVREGGSQDLHQDGLLPAVSAASGNLR